MTKTETRNDKLRAAHDKLQAAVTEIVSGDDWKRMLKPNSVGPPSGRLGPRSEEAGNGYFDWLWLS